VLTLFLHCYLTLSPLGAAQVGGVGDLQHRHKGDAYKDSFGQSCAFLGDVNGDGLADYAVGADEYDSLGITNTGLVRVFSGADGSVIHEIFGSERIELLGRYLGLAGDVNADGTFDFLVAAYGKQRVDVYSGIDATKLLEIASPFSGVGFGISLQRLGDINLDGHDDFVIGSPDVATALGIQTGVASIYSGADGSELLRIEGLIAQGKLGGNIRAFPDYDGDQLPDLLIASIVEDVPGYPRAGAVRIFSSASGAVLFEFFHEAPLIGIGTALAVLPDFDGDGTSDFFAASTRDGPTGISTGGFGYIVDGMNGDILHRFVGDQFAQQFGASACQTGDLTGDGVPDFAVGSREGSIDGEFDRAGFVDLYCGRTARLIHRVGAEANYAYLGAALDGGMDVDGDGIPEILACAPKDFIEADEGTAYVFSYRSLIQIDEIELSVAQGGTTSADLLFPTSDADKGYALLASMRGFGVTRVDGIDVPLKRDKLFDLMLAGHAPSEFANAYGRLNSTGQATATVTIPAAASSALIGRRLHLAAISFSNQRVRRSSGAVHIDFVL